MSDKRKFPYSEAIEVANKLKDYLYPFCEQIEIAGSLRRLRKYVGDIEILFVPKLSPNPNSLFAAFWGPDKAEMVDLADLTINRLVKHGILEQRKNSKGSVMWGAQNKLAIHAKSGIPVDFFSTTQERWFTSLVIRTGGKKTNIALAIGAKMHGLKLNPYGEGFTERKTGCVIRCNSEGDVFRFAGLRYQEPQY